MCCIPFGCVRYWAHTGSHTCQGPSSLTQITETLPYQFLSISSFIFNTFKIECILLMFLARSRRHHPSKVIIGCHFNGVNSFFNRMAQVKLEFFLHLFIYFCVCTWHSTWRPEDHYWKSLLSFQLVGCRDWTQVACFDWQSAPFTSWTTLLTQQVKINWQIKCFWTSHLWFAHKMPEMKGSHKSNVGGVARHLGFSYKVTNKCVVER